MSSHVSTPLADSKPVSMLDAETCGAVLRRSQIDLLERIARIEVAQVCISSVTLSELLFAARMSRSSERDLRTLELFLKHVAVVPYASEAAREYGAIRERLFWREESIGLHELLVASHAKSLGVTLVTKRLREFGRVPGLLVESWDGCPGSRIDPGRTCS